MTDAINLHIEDLTPHVFAPFGDVLQRPNRAPVSEGPGFRWWGELIHLAGGDQPYAVGIVDIEPAPLDFNWAERHMRSEELLVPLGDDCLVYVGPPDYPDEPSRLPSIDNFRVFRVLRGQGVLLKAGVWHGAPMTTGGPLTVLVTLLHNAGTQDTTLIRFEDTPVTLVQ